MRNNYVARSWEWIDQQLMVNRERSLSSDKSRLISRELVVHSEQGVMADQFYAERLYSKEGITQLLAEIGFKDLRGLENTNIPFILSSSIFTKGDTKDEEFGFG